MQTNKEGERDTKKIDDTWALRASVVACYLVKRGVRVEHYEDWHEVCFKLVKLRITSGITILRLEVFISSNSNILSLNLPP